VALAVLSLFVTSCVVETIKSVEMDRSELDDPGPLMSFEVELTVDSVVASQFAPVRVLVEEESGKGQLGYTVAIPDPASRRYKITLPESYKEKEDGNTFVVEFRKINSGFDDVDTLQKVPLALNMLKSRYIEFHRESIPDPPERKKLSVGSKDELKLGYGPGGLRLKDIPNVPPIYLINITLDETVKKYGFTYAGGVATSFVEEKYPPFTEIISRLNDTANIYGITVTTLDWFLIMRPEVYVPGDAFSLWIYVKQPVEPGAVHACPCQGGPKDCICNPCPYTLLNKYYGQDYYPIHIQIDNIEELEVGGSINISIDPSYFLSCADLFDKVVTKPDIPGFPFFEETPVNSVGD
ncbi:MAG: hypothetical protein LBH18_07985, partial [Spirochaetaceae bacterium]|nr:hypothetical protein [Spirochaetaceae bacterium]